MRVSIITEVKDKCGKCGAKISPGYDFCLSCGTKFSEIPPTTKKRKKGMSGAGSIAGSVVGTIAETAECFDCFIATAAYGSHLSPQVTFLKYVRDIRLKQSRLGNLFVNRFEWVYYKFSPHVA